MTVLVLSLVVLVLVLLNVWQHVHHERAVERWRAERRRR